MLPGAEAALEAHDMTPRHWWSQLIDVPARIYGYHCWAYWPRWQKARDGTVPRYFLVFN